MKILNRAPLNIAQKTLCALFLGIVLFLGTTLDAETAKSAAKSFISKIKVTALGCTLEGTLTVYTDDAGNCSHWEFEGTFDLLIGSKKNVKYGGKFSIVNGGGSVIPNGSKLDGEHPLTTLITDGDIVGFKVPIVDENDNIIGFMMYNLDLLQSNTETDMASIFIYPFAKFSPFVDSTYTNSFGFFDLNIRVVSVEKGTLVYEFNNPREEGLQIFLYDIMGNEIEHFVWFSKGPATNRVKNLLPGKYYIYSPVDTKPACSVIVK